MAGDRNDGPEVVEGEVVGTAAIRRVVPMADIRQFFDESFATLGRVLAGQGVVPTGPPYGHYRGMPTDTVDVEVGFPVAVPVQPEGDVVNAELPGGRVARVVHQGGFDGLGDAYGRLSAWITGQGLVPADHMWEVYLTEPEPGGDPALNRTEIRWPVVG